MSKDTKLIKRLRDIEAGLSEKQLEVGDPAIVTSYSDLDVFAGLQYGSGEGGVVAVAKIGLIIKGGIHGRKRGLKPDCFPAKYSNKLAILGLNQLKKLERFNDHRKKLQIFTLSS